MYKAFDLCVEDSFLRCLDVDLETLIAGGQEALENANQKAKEILDDVSIHGTI